MNRFSGFWGDDRFVDSDRIATVGLNRFSGLSRGEMPDWWNRCDKRGSATASAVYSKMEIWIDGTGALSVGL